MIKKIFALILIILLIPFSLSGCYDSYGIENLAYVTAIGIDEGKENLLKLTLQFATPSSSGKGGSSSQSESSSTLSIECSSIDTGLANANNYISKKINLAHTKIIVISEPLAVNGISQYVNTFSTNIEVRPDCNILISKCEASKFIEQSKPSLTNLTARYYEVLINSKEYTGFAEETPLWKFYTKLEEKTIEPIAALCGLHFEGIKTPISNSNLLDTDTSYKAGDSPIKSDSLSQNIGLAVFSNDKLVGELDAMQAFCFLLLSNGLNTSNISIPSPFEVQSSIAIKLSLKHFTKKNVKLVNGSPYIICDLNLEGQIISLGTNADYSKEEHLKLVEEYTSSYLKSHLNNFLYKTAKEYKADIVGFGRNLVGSYATIGDWNNSNWLANYKNSFFKVNVNINIKSGSLFIKDK